MGEPYVNGMQVVAKDDKLGIIALDGKVISEPQWDQIGDYPMNSFV